ncbi:MAG TPA: nickel pincer cofactor biosynthesis protein LarB [Tepidisphaeraceae bacterium]|nr:nickel pincer cofactor biosynthesis protein LarB [Tepidisphaeraceae bacterium]
MWNEQSIAALLERVANREQSVEEACAALGALPFEDIEFAKIDHHRQIRRGFAEVVYCAGKTPAQSAEIIARLAARTSRVLGTRAAREHFEAAVQRVPDVQYDETARVLWLDREPDRPRRKGVVLLAAGTSDLPVAEEAALTLDLMGHLPLRIYDVGVAGLQRILHHVPVLRSANVVIVVAGMEGALPGVVAGLIEAPVIAVPTSVGYGASFGGLAALLGMLNSCSPGVAVVNIDNGYGAGHMAAAINAKICGKEAGGA